METILKLSETLSRLGYDQKTSEKLLNVLSDIDQNGYSIINGTTIGGSRVQPKFKINPKSVDVYIYTSHEMDMFRIFHPTQTWYGSKAQIFFGSRKWFAEAAGKHKDDFFRRMIKF